jgi:hypothetical protein
MGGYLASRLLKHCSRTFDRVTDSLIFNMDCVSKGLGRSWFPVTSYTWKCLACCAHQRLLFQHIHKFLLRKDVRPRKRSLFHCPPSRVSLVSTDIISSVRTNLIFTNNCLGFETFQIRRTAGSGYINALEELPGFEQEPMVIWLILMVFVDHRLYSKKWVLDIYENCDDEPSNLPWYLAGFCAVYNTRPTMVYIPSES